MDAVPRVTHSTSPSRDEAEEYEAEEYEAEVVTFIKHCWAVKVFARDDVTSNHDNAKKTERALGLKLDIIGFIQIFDLARASSLTFPVWTAK